MKRRTRAVVALMAGGIAFAVAEAVQARKLLQTIQRDGVVVHVTNLPVIDHADAHIGGGDGHGGSSTAVVLSKDAQAQQGRMHKVAAGVAVASVVVVGLVTWGE